MLVAVAVCPHPPMLIPALASGAAAELNELRAACGQAIRALVAADPHLVCIVGDAPAARWYAEGASGSLAPYGLPLQVPLATQTTGPATLPLSLTVGAWLLHESGWAGPRRALGVPGHVARAHLQRLAGELTATSARTGLLVMGDGSARHTEKAPGYVDPRSPAFDGAVRAALSGADTGALTGLDQRLGDELLAAGTASWRLLGLAAAGGPWNAELLAASAPYGVGYFVATWQRPGAPS